MSRWKVSGEVVGVEWVGAGFVAGYPSTTASIRPRPVVREAQAEQLGCQGTSSDSREYHNNYDCKSHRLISFQPFRDLVIS